jgi:hypothetical protein
MIGHERDITKLAVIEVLQEFEGIAADLCGPSELAFLSFDWNLGRWAKIVVELVRRSGADCAFAINEELLEIPPA